MKGKYTVRQNTFLTDVQAYQLKNTLILIIIIFNVPCPICIKNPFEGSLFVCQSVLFLDLQLS